VLQFTFEAAGHKAALPMAVTLDLKDLAVIAGGFNLLKKLNPPAKSRSTEHSFAHREHDRRARGRGYKRTTYGPKGK
jgi:hypothetical protein